MVLKSLFGKKDLTKKVDNSAQAENTDENLTSEPTQQQSEPSPAVHL